MTSPLLPYANSWLLINIGNTPSVVNGRVVQSVISYRIVQCYLKRQQSTGTSTGGDYVLSQTQANLETGSAGGVVYLYRGYALGYIALNTKPDFNTFNVSGSSYTPFNLTNSVPWMTSGVTGLHRQGIEKPAHFSFESVGGKFGDLGVDQIVNEAIEGIPIVIRSGQVLN